MGKTIVKETPLNSPWVSQYAAAARIEAPCTMIAGAYEFGTSEAAPRRPSAISLPASNMEVTYASGELLNGCVRRISCLSPLSLAR